MYYEPTKKTYYRFPSQNSVHDFDTKYYYPDKRYTTGENAHFDTQVTNREQDRTSYQNI